MSADRAIEFFFFLEYKSLEKCSCLSVDLVIVPCCCCCVSVIERLRSDFPVGFSPCKFPEVKNHDLCCKRSEIILKILPQPHFSLLVGR